MHFLFCTIIFIYSKFIFNFYEVYMNSDMYVNVYVIGVFTYIIKHIEKSLF